MKKNEIDKIRCNIQGFTMVWFENSQYLWCTLIAWSVYNSVICFDGNISQKTTFYKRIKYLFIGYVLPFIIALYGFFRDLYGPSGNWCWIESVQEDVYDERKIFSVILFSFVWVLIFSNFTLNYLVIRFLNKEFISPQEKELAKKYIWKLIRYPLIQIICIFPGTIDRLLEVFFHKQVHFLKVLHLICILVQGIAYGIALRL